MIELTEADYAKFKRSLEESGAKYETEAEYREAARNLVNFAELIYDMSKEELLRKKRLEREPEGFQMEGEGRTCSLCKRAVYAELKLWYDKWGMKCMDCQNALNKKIIPGYVFNDQDNTHHITASTLLWKFKIRRSTIAKLIQQGKLKPRIIPGSDTVVFLATENRDIVTVIEAAKKA
jgi:hypothetical protein